MKDFLENYNLLFAMTILIAFTIAFKCMCAIIYQVLLRDSEQVPSTKNKWIRAMYTKFEACYKLKIPIHNPGCFIENHMAQYHFLGISMKTLENTDIFCGLIVTASTLLSIMCGIYYEFPMRWTLIHSMTLVFFLLFLAASELLFQVRHKRSLLRLQLLNYFENTLQAKLENQYLHPEERRAYENAYFDQEEEPGKKAEGQKEENIAAAAERLPSSVAPDMQELIDSLLEESKITEEINEQQEKLHAAATNEKYRLVEEIIKEYF